MTPKMSQICEQLGVLVEQTISLLEDSTEEGADDLSGLSNGLRDAHDTGQILSKVADYGVDIPVDLIDAVERLVRATLSTQPMLMRRDVDNLSAEAPPDPPELALQVSDLCSRAMHASVELHRGLAGIYRNATDRGVER